MKKFIITLLLLVPVLSGCASVNTNLTINNDKSASVAINLKSNNPIAPQELLTMKRNYKKFLDTKYSVTNKSTRKDAKYNAVKSVKNLKKEDIDLSSLGFKSKLKSKKFVEVKQNFFVTSYNIHMVYDIKTQAKRIKFVDTKTPENQSLSMTPEYFQKYADKDILNDNSNNADSDFMANFEQNEISKNETQNMKEIPVEDEYTPFSPKNLSATFSITLPMAASYNNADKSGANTYIWNLKRNEPVDIQLQYVVYSGFAITLLIFAGILLLLYVARRIWRHDMGKRIGNGNQ